MNETLSRRSLMALAALAWAVSAQLANAAPAAFTVPLAGANEVPAVASPGSGAVALTYDRATSEVTWTVTTSGLSSDTTMAHFHGPAEPGKNAGVVIWMSTKGEAPPNPITGKAILTPEQAAQFTAGEWYMNVHTKDHPNGEIRGQVTPPKS